MNFGDIEQNKPNMAFDEGLVEHDDELIQHEENSSINNNNRKSSDEIE